PPRSDLCSRFVQPAGADLSLLRSWTSNGRHAMKRLLLLVWLISLGLGFAAAQVTVSGDVLGMHNLTPGSGASVYSQGSLGCTYCHAPHSGLGGNTPLWNQKLSQKTYTPYTSTTYAQQGNTQPTLGVTSSLCLSCHDGT